MGRNDGFLKARRTPESDVYYTPEYAITPLIKYLKGKYQTIWCPFDTEESFYVKTLKKYGFDVIYSHIDNGQDFFKYEPEHYDCIVSNPPYSIKDKVLERLYNLDKPYAMLLPLPTLQGQKRFKYLVGKQALIFNKRVQYIKDLNTMEFSNKASFGSIYVCNKILPNDLIFEEL